MTSPDSLPRALRHPNVLPLIKAIDEQFYVGRLTGSFGFRFHYRDGVLEKIRVYHPEHEIVVRAEIDT